MYIGTKNGRGKDNAVCFDTAKVREEFHEFLSPARPDHADGPRASLNRVRELVEGKAHVFHFFPVPCPHITIGEDHVSLCTRCNWVMDGSDKVLKGLVLPEAFAGQTWSSLGRDRDNLTARGTE